MSQTIIITSPSNENPALNEDALQESPSLDTAKNTEIDFEDVDVKATPATPELSYIIEDPRLCSEYLPITNRKDLKSYSDCLVGYDNADAAKQLRVHMTPNTPGLYFGITLGFEPPPYLLEDGSKTWGGVLGFPVEVRAPGGFGIKTVAGSASQSRTEIISDADFIVENQTLSDSKLIHKFESRHNIAPTTAYWQTPLLTFPANPKYIGLGAYKGPDALALDLGFGVAYQFEKIGSQIVESFSRESGAGERVVSGSLGDFTNSVVPLADIGISYYFLPEYIHLRLGYSRYFDANAQQPLEYVSLSYGGGIAFKKNDK